MVAPEIETGVVLGDLIADLVTPLLTIALQLLSILDAAGTIALQLLSILDTAGTIAAQILSASCRRADTNTSHGVCSVNARSGRKLRRSGPTSALQEIGRGAAGSRPGTACSRGRARDVQEVV